MSDAKSNGSQLAVPHVLLLIILASASGIIQKLYRAQAIYFIVYLFIVCLVSFSSHGCYFYFFLSDSSHFWQFVALNHSYLLFSEFKTI